MQEGACATHFEAGSRGCGVLLMGCQSLCRLRTRPCRRGHLQLLAPTTLVSGRSQVVSVAVMQEESSDLPVTVVIALTSPCAASTAVSVSARDPGPHQATFPLTARHILCGGLRAQLLSAANSTVGPLREIEIVFARSRDHFALYDPAIRTQPLSTGATVNITLLRTCLVCPAAPHTSLQPADALTALLTVPLPCRGIRITQGWVLQCPLYVRTGHWGPNATAHLIALSPGPPALALSLRLPVGDPSTHAAGAVPELAQVLAPLLLRIPDA